MWELLETVTDILCSAVEVTVLEEAPRSVRIGCTAVSLLVVLALFGWAMWNWLR